MPFPKIKLSDDSGNAVGVTDNRLNVNAYLAATPTIDIGDVSLLLDGTAASTNAGTMDAQTLRVTLATDDTHWGEVGATADVDGVAHGQLRYIGNALSNQTVIASYLNTTQTILNFAASTTGGPYAEGDGGFLATGVRNDTLATLVSVDHDHAPFQVNADGALYIDGSNSTQPVSGTVTANLGTTDNAVLDAMVVDLAAMEALLITIDSDTDAIKTATQLIDDAVYADDGDFTLNSSKGVAMMAFQGSQSITSGDVGVLRCTSDGFLKIDIAAFSAVNIITASETTLGTSTYTEGSTTGNVIGVVRNDTLAALANTDNELAPLQVNASGALYVEVASSASHAVTNAGTFAVQSTLQANSGVDIGDVDVTSLPASTNTIEIVGDAAEDAAVAGNPVLVGGRYDSSPRSLDDGDVGAIAVTPKGYSIVSLDSNWATGTNGYGSAFHVAGDGFSQATDATLSIAAVLSDALAAPANTTDGDWCPLQVDAQGALYTTHGMTAMVSGANATISDSTAEQLDGSTSGLDVACKRVDLMATHFNTGYIWVGDSGVANNGSGGGIRLAPGDFYSIDVNNLNDIWVIATVDEENVTYMYFT